MYVWCCACCRAWAGYRRAQRRQCGRTHTGEGGPGGLLHRQAWLHPLPPPSPCPPPAAPSSPLAPFVCVQQARHRGSRQEAGQLCDHPRNHPRQVGGLGRQWWVAGWALTYMRLSVVEAWRMLGGSRRLCRARAPRCIACSRAKEVSPPTPTPTTVAPRRACLHHPEPHQVLPAQRRPRHHPHTGRPRLPHKGGGGAGPGWQAGQL